MCWGRLQETQDFCSPVNLLWPTFSRQTNRSISLRLAVKDLSLAANLHVKYQNRNAPYQNRQHIKGKIRGGSWTILLHRPDTSASSGWTAQCKHHTVVEQKTDSLLQVRNLGESIYLSHIEGRKTSGGYGGVTALRMKNRKFILWEVWREKRPECKRDGSR